ncbi:Nn.00g053820.m01.CDS01 [Neocucurbitaria sp. VM-36]
MLLNTLVGCQELENPPWSDETAVYIDRFEFAVLYDDEKIREDAESRPKPGWPGFDASVMGMLHRHKRFREAKEEAVPERLSYRFCVRLGDMSNPSLAGDRRFCLQRLGERIDYQRKLQFSGLQGRLIGAGGQRIERWLTWSRLCLERHRKTCFPDFLRDDYPGLRLVDVRRRCIVDHLESRTYTALSYVWGAKQNLVLTKANYAELHTPGALADSCDLISKTVRDVLNLCQHVSNYLRAGPLLSNWDTLSLVGWEYIWIDALCIVQDDPTDKQHHINRMDKLYAGAWQTIVAASKDGVEAGLSGVGKEIPSVDQHVDYIDGIPFMSTKQSYLMALTESQWETRGWIFQEKHLSKRLLVFTDGQCFWHCSCVTWYEDTELECPNSSFPHLRAELRHPDDPTRDPKKHLKWDPEQSDIERYRMLANSYVRRKLKYDSDGLDSMKAVFTGLIDKDIRSADNDRTRDNMRDVLWSPSKRKYFWALPEIYLPAFLLIKWTTENPWSTRRDHFPSWFWLSRSIINTGDEVLGSHISQTEVTPRVPFYRFDDQGKPVMLDCVQVYKSGITPSEDEFDSTDDKQANMPSIILVDGPDTAEILNKEHDAHSKNILALDKNKTPHISHLLAFRELTCKLWVDTEPIEMKPEDLCDNAPDSVAFHVRFKDGGPAIGLMHLHRLWRRRRPQWLDFVVVNETANFISTPCLNFLCVEWNGTIATRVQALIAVKVNDDSAAHPVERKLVLLA